MLFLLRSALQNDLIKPFNSSNSMPSPIFIYNSSRNSYHILHACLVDGLHSGRSHQILSILSNHYQCLYFHRSHPCIHLNWHPRRAVKEDLLASDKCWICLNRMFGPGTFDHQSIPFPSSLVGVCYPQHHWIGSLKHGSDGNHSCKLLFSRHPLP